MKKNNSKQKEQRNPKLRKESNWTYEDYAKLPDDGNRFELSDGNLELLAPSPSGKHQVFTAEIGFALNNLCGNDCIIVYAPVDLILSDKEVKQPDIVMLHRSKTDMIQDKGIVGIPDLIIEVLSPSSIRRDK